MVSYRAEHQPLNHPATPFSTPWKVLQRYDFFRNCARKIVEFRCPYLLGLKVAAVPESWNYGCFCGFMELRKHGITEVVPRRLVMHHPLVVL